MLLGARQSAGRNKVRAVRPPAGCPPGPAPANCISDRDSKHPAGPRTPTARPRPRPRAAPAPRRHSSSSQTCLTVRGARPRASANRTREQRLESREPGPSVLGALRAHGCLPVGGGRADSRPTSGVAFATRYTWRWAVGAAGEERATGTSLSPMVNLSWGSPAVSWGPPPWLARVCPWR